MKTRPVLIVVAVLSIILFGVLYVRFTGQNQQGITIGVVLPLSGSMAEYGNNARMGLTLASEELATKPDMKKFKLSYQDTKDAPQDTVNAVRRLVDVDGVKFIIGGLTSSGVLAAAPYAQQHGVLFFSPAASAPGIPEIGNLVFRNWPGDDALATQFGRVAYDKLGARTIAILHVSNDYGKTNAESFSAAFRAAGGTIPLVRAFSQGSTEFKALIAQVNALAQIDKVFLVAYPDELRGLFQEIAISQLRPGSVLASDAFYSPKLLSELGKIADGTICAVAAKPDDQYEPRRRFIDSYQTRFKGPDGKPLAPGLVSDTAYDALNLVVTGISRSDGSPQAVSNWLLQQVKDYRGASGVVNFTQTGDVKGDLALFKVVNGTFVAER